MSIGRRVRSVRLAQGRSQREVAEEAGVGVSYMSRVENGHGEPSTRMLAKLAGAMRVEVSDFFDGEPLLEASDTCPVSLSGCCILEHPTSCHHRHGDGTEHYSTEHLEALKSLNRVLHEGSERELEAVRALLERMDTKGGKSL